LLVGRHRPLRQGADDVRPGGGIYLFDDKGTQYLDLQMWYSAVNFGYGNPRLNAALKRQIDRPAPAGLPVPAQGEDPARDQSWRESRVGLRGEGPDPLQRRRCQRHRGRLEGGAEPHEEEFRVRLHGRISRAHARRLGHHLQLSLPREVRPFPTGRTSSLIPTASAAPTDRSVNPASSTA
jgi:hypothetical protein